VDRNRLDPNKLTIIAEIGEHPHVWPEMLKLAKWAGADAVKVQLWRSGHFPKGEKTQADEFPREQFREFVQVAHSWDMLAGASVFDPAAVWLASSGDFLKLATREEHNWPLRLLCLIAGRAFGVPVLRSVDAREPSGMVWPGEKTMGCLPLYPSADYYWVGFYATPRSRKVGWSSHGGGPDECVSLARIGVTVLEKHLCPPDATNEWSLPPAQFKEMVDAIRA
jgi:sialic acid synthase SpsE